MVFSSCRNEAHILLESTRPIMQTGNPCNRRAKKSAKHNYLRDCWKETNSLQHFKIGGNPPAKGNAGYTRGPDNPFEKRSGKTGSSWWLNQPIWKMCYLDHVPRDRGENKQWLKPSPRYGFGLGIKELPQEIGTVKLDPLQPRKWTNS